MSIGACLALSLSLSPLCVNLFQCSREPKVNYSLLGVLMKVLAIHRIMPMLLLLLTASWGLIALFDMFEAGITHLS
jgi:hypothetical protein